MVRNFYDNPEGRYSMECDRANVALRLIADDLAIFSRLHSSEVDADLLDRLSVLGFPGTLAISPEPESDYAANNRAVADYIRTWKYSDARERKTVLETLATDYASIFLNGLCGVSPEESFYSSNSGELRTDVMFILRNMYESAGLENSDERNFSDDHVALQLEFAGYILHDRGPDAILPAIEILENHVGRWYPDFAGRVGQCIGEGFYSRITGIMKSYVPEVVSILKRLCPEKRIIK